MAIASSCHYNCVSHHLFHAQTSNYHPMKYAALWEMCTHNGSKTNGKIHALEKYLKKLHLLAFSNDNQVSNIGFIAVYGPNEGHMAPFFNGIELCVECLCLCWYLIGNVGHWNVWFVYLCVCLLKGQLNIGNTDAILLWSAVAYSGVFCADNTFSTTRLKD